MSFGKESSYIPLDTAPLESAMHKGAIDDICQNTYNIFESVVESEREEVGIIKEILIQKGARCAMMSGSGPSVFGIFDSKSASDEAAECLEAQEIVAFSVMPVSKI